MNSQNPAGAAKGDSGQKFSQQLVNQTPVYDKILKVKRPRKKKKGPNWL
jgi:hypothetical protein